MNYKNTLHYNWEDFKKIDSYRNSFFKIADVKTDLLCGDPEKIVTPWVSVIIPTYNRKKLFQEALKSVLNQLPVDFEWEILVMDNTPMDEKGETPAFNIIQQLNDSRILYYHNRKTVWSGYNWNRGVELARGEWVTFLHDDDLLCSDALLNIGNIIRAYRNLSKPLGYIHARRRDFADEFDENLVKKYEKKYDQMLTRFGALIYGDTRTGAPSCGTTILKKAYVHVGGVNAAYGGTADAVLGYQIMKNFTVLHSGKVLGGYRWQDNATLRKSTILELVETDLLFARYRYGLTLWSRIFGDFFGRIQYNMNIQGKQKIVNKGCNILSIQDFDYITEYKKSNIVLQYIYKIIKNIYHQLEKHGRYFG